MSERTTEYSMFKRHPRNRPLDEGNVQRIMRSIQFNNLLHRRPLEVNAQMEVLDGQHRLEAGKRLGLPVYYEIKEDMKADDIRLLNDNQKRWSLNDYLNFHARGGNKEYVRLEDFMRKHEMGLVAALIALRQGGRAKDPDSFKKGTFVFPSLEEEIESIEILNKAKKVVEYVIARSPGIETFLKSQKFFRCVSLFVSYKSVDFDLFIKKLSQKLEMIRPASRIVDIMEYLKNIYNWKNQNPISLGSGED